MASGSHRASEIPAAGAVLPCREKLLQVPRPHRKVASLAVGRPRHRHSVLSEPSAPVRGVTGQTDR